MTVSDDSFLRRLAAADADDGLSADERLDLERLCAGELPAVERGALVRRADERARQGDPRLRDAIAAHEPLSNEARARVVDAVVGKRAPREAAAAPRSPRRRNFLVWLVPTFATGAAAVALWPRHRDGAGLPFYSVDVGGGMSDLRGPSAPPLGRLTPDAPLRLNLRPRTRVAGPVSVRTFLDAQGNWGELPLVWQRNPSGAFHAQGTVTSLLGAVSGRVRLHLVVGGPDLVTHAGERLARGAEDTGPGWQRLTVSLDITPAPTR